MAIDKSADWREVHKQLVEHKGRRALLDYDEGELLIAAHRAAVHVYLGYATFEQYIDFLLGYPVRMTRERLRVARCLHKLPGLARAMREGEISWSCARELTRVAVSETEEQWLTAARGKAVRQVALVSGHHQSARRLPHRSCPVRGPSLCSPHGDLGRNLRPISRGRGQTAQRRRRHSDAAGSLDKDEVLLLMAPRSQKGPRTRVARAIRLPCRSVPSALGVPLRQGASRCRWGRRSSRWRAVMRSISAMWARPTWVGLRRIFHPRSDGR
jgi:hypothetical protein